jgi:hypothetical protein
MSIHHSIVVSSLLSCAMILPNLSAANTIYQSAAYGAGESQNSAFSSSVLNAPLFPSAIGESFTLASSANISSLDFYVDGFVEFQNINVFFHHLTDNPSTNLPIYSQSYNFLQYTRTTDVITGPKGDTDNIHFSFSTPLSLSAGAYAVFLTNPSNTDLGISRFGPNPNCVGSDCDSFTDFGNTQVQVNADGKAIGFTGYASGMRLNGELSQVSAVPAPAAAWLFATGLPLLMRFRAKKQSS